MFPEQQEQYLVSLCVDSVKAFIITFSESFEQHLNVYIYRIPQHSVGTIRVTNIRQLSESIIKCHLNPLHFCFTVTAGGLYRQRSMVELLLVVVGDTIHFLSLLNHHFLFAAAHF